MLVVGDPGQFDVLVGGQVIATRGGSLLARLFGGGWPDPARVVEILKARSLGSASVK
jgi:hypothetical protein